MDDLEFDPNKKPLDDEFEEDEVDLSGEPAPHEEEDEMSLDAMIDEELDEDDGLHDPKDDW